MKKNTEAHKHAFEIDWNNLISDEGFACEIDILRYSTKTVEECLNLHYETGEQTLSINASILTL